MLIDIILCLLILLAIIKGYRKGFILAVFSFIALIVGLAAALKLSALVAGYLKGSSHNSSKWLPFLSFIVVFLLVLLLAHLGGKLIEKTFKMVMLGWLNRIAGIILYSIIYIIVFSVFLFYAEKIHLFTYAAFQASETWPFIKPLGPKAINGFSKAIPLFKNMFNQLEGFFGRFSEKAAR